MPFQSGWWNIIYPALTQSKENQVFLTKLLIASILKSCRTNVVWPNARVSRPDEQNDIQPTSFVNVWPTKLPTKCQRWPNELLLSGLVSFHFKIVDKHMYMCTVLAVLPFDVYLRQLINIFICVLFWQYFPLMFIVIHFFKYSNDYTHSYRTCNIINIVPITE